MLHSCFAAVIFVGPFVGPIAHSWDYVKHNFELQVLHDALHPNYAACLWTQPCLGPGLIAHFRNVAHSGLCSPEWAYNIFMKATKARALLHSWLYSPFLE